VKKGMMNRVVTPETRGPLSAEEELGAKEEQQRQEQAEAAKREKQFVNATAANPPVAKSPADELRERMAEKASKGMLCANTACRSRHTKVTRTVQREGGVIVRYRECGTCGHSFSTEEKPRV